MLKVKVNFKLSRWLMHALSTTMASIKYCVPATAIQLAIIIVIIIIISSSSSSSR